MPLSRFAAIVGAALALAVPASANAAARILPSHAGLKDLDARTGRVAATAAQKQAVSALNARAQWNRYGTVASLIADDGFLTGVSSGSAPEIARAFIRSHADLFRLTAADVDGLELVNDAKLVASDGHAVLFRQHFGALTAGHDGMIRVGVSGGRVAYVSSSAAGSQAAPAAATLSATDAWLKAAANAGLGVSRAALKTPTTRDGWTTFDVSGLATPLVGKQAIGQRARLVAFPTYTQGVRAAFETVVLDVQGGRSRAYRSFVDARTGEVLYRSNEVKELADDQPSGGTFTGNTGSGCGDPQPIDVAGAFSVSVVASANLPSDDIVLKLMGPGGSAVASSDTGTSPEAVNYTGNGGKVADGTYQIVVCAFNDPTVPASGDSFDYTGGWAINTVAGAPSTAANPSWPYFANAPAGDNRLVGCFLAAAGCDAGLNNTASRGPWDVMPATGTPTFTTQGNNARTAEARTT